MSRYVFLKKLGKIVDATSGHTVIQHLDIPRYIPSVGRFNIYPDAHADSRFIRHGFC